MRDQVIELAEQAGVDPDDLVEYWSERAAIREIDGGQTRDDAEQGALADIRELLAAGDWMLERKGPKSVASDPSGSVVIDATDGRQLVNRR